MRPYHRTRVVASLLLLIMVPEACYRWVPAPTTVPVLVSQHPGVLRFRTDSATIEMHHPRLSGDSVVGDRGGASSPAFSPVSVPLADVTGAETHQFDVGRTAALVILLPVIALAPLVLLAPLLDQL